MWNSHSTVIKSRYLLLQLHVVKITLSWISLYLFTQWTPTEKVKRRECLNFSSHTSAMYAGTVKVGVVMASSIVTADSEAQGKIRDGLSVVCFRQKLSWAILLCHSIPSGTCLVGLNFVLPQDNDLRNTSSSCKRDRKGRRLVSHIMVISASELVWYGLDRRPESPVIEEQWTFSLRVGVGGIFCGSKMYLSQSCKTWRSLKVLYLYFWKTTKDT